MNAEKPSFPENIRKPSWPETLLGVLVIVIISGIWIVFEYTTLVPYLSDGITCDNLRNLDEYTPYAAYLHDEVLRCNYVK